jgi:Asp-tRNA(Asn)/Glu-tRNA(Gln) amidotransferase A subunit family amidase
VNHVERCLAVVERREQEVRAFAWLDPEQACARAAAAVSGPLAGLPVGVKDIIDTAGIPTERGSALYGGRVPERSAAVVRRLEAAGAVIFGKTVTAELAFAYPGPTRNPWDPTRTPGGSSMGSAAAVGAGMLPAALGTQTNSSIIMPAALCGVVGFKPSAGRSDCEGVMAFSPTLDELGCLAETVEDVIAVAPVLGDLALDAATSSVAGLRVLSAFGSGWPDAAPCVSERFAYAVETLRAAGARVLPTDGAPFAEARAAHRTIMAYEAWVQLGADVSARPQLVSEWLRRFLAEGKQLTADDHRAALDARDALITAFDRLIDGADVIVSPSAPDEAPEAAGTGDPRFCTLWTLVGAPAINLPCGRGPHGLPIGLQLIGKRGEDAALLAFARAIEPLVA